MKKIAKNVDFCQFLAKMCKILQNLCKICEKLCKIVQNFAHFPVFFGILPPCTHGLTGSPASKMYIFSEKWYFGMGFPGGLRCAQPLELAFQARNKSFVWVSQSRKKNLAVHNFSQKLQKNAFFCKFCDNLYNTLFEWKVSSS